MINLLPPQVKEDYKYARHNSTLIRMLMALGFGIAGLALIAAAGMFYLHQSASTYANQSAQMEEVLAGQDSEAVRKEAQEMSNSLKLAVQVLSKEVLFSQLLKQLAVAIPSDVRLTDVTINELGGGINVSAEATDYSAATQLQVNLADPNNMIFAEADIINISCDSISSGERSHYPCRITVRALFADNNPFLFINSKSAGGQTP